MPPKPRKHTTLAQAAHYNPNKDARPKVLVLYTFSESAQEVAQRTVEILSQNRNQITVGPRRYAWGPGMPFDCIIVFGADHEREELRPQLLANLQQWETKDHLFIWVNSYASFISSPRNYRKTRTQWLSEMMETVTYSLSEYLSV